MSSIQIIKASLTDVGLLQEISRKTFFDTFAEVNSEENMKNYLEHALSTEQLSSELANASSEFYFAFADDVLAGYLKLNAGDAQTEVQVEAALEVERIYVIKQMQGKGIGQALNDFAIHRAKQQGAKYIWLGVWENNPKAIDFYKKNGFVEFGQHIFPLGDDDQRDLLMKKELKDA